MSHSGNEAWNSLCAWYDSWFPVEDDESEGIDEEEETCGESESEAEGEE